MTPDLVEVASPAESAPLPRERSRAASLWRSLRRRPGALLAAAWLVVLVLVAAFGPLVVSEAAIQQSLATRNAAPLSFDAGWWYVLGSDPLGRSVLARMMLAARTTVLVAGLAVLFSGIVGTMLGVVAGFRQGVFSQLVQRLTDVIMSFPSLLLAVVILYVFDAGVANLVLVLGITRVPVYLRVCRAETLEVRQRDFVEASLLFGTPTSVILRRHAVPNVLPSVTTLMSLEFAFVMLAESSLSFLGIGIQPPDVTWGLMVAQGRSYVVEAWWLTVFAGAAIVSAAAAANVLARWLRSATDPASGHAARGEGDPS